MANRQNAIIFAVLGILGVLAGTLMLLFVTTVSCGGDEMKPGDICKETKKGTTTQYTYDEMQSKDKRMGLFALGAGVLGFGMSGYCVVAMKRRQREEQEAIASSQQWAAQ